MQVQGKEMVGIGLCVRAIERRPEKGGVGSSEEDCNERTQNDDCEEEYVVVGISGKYNLIKFYCICLR